MLIPKAQTNRNAVLLACTLCLTIFISACTPSQESGIAEVKPSKAVAMPDSFSADAAMAVLDEGGNAIDAAITAQFVLAVTLPEAGNIGGGGFMLVYHQGEADFLDYRETAPEKAHRDMYLDENGNVKTQESIYGILASGTPGTVSGMWEAHKKYGSLPWQRLLQPAVDLAENGFLVHPKLARNIQRYNDKIEEKSLAVNFAEYFPPVDANTLFVQSELAATLKRIQAQGKDGFYKGETADIIDAFMQQEGGILSKQDLASYQAKWRQPIASQWREYELYSAAPPSSGGIAISQWLQMFDLVVPERGSVAHNSPEYVHLLAEIGKRVFADRAEYLGDPDFYDVPKTELLSNAYLKRRAQEVDRNNISVTEDIRPGLGESLETTHFSIVDQFGNAVSNTTTINLGFGSGMVVRGAGFLLNDEMDDFSAKAGVPNYFGAVGGTANEIQPFKRMLSSMTPTLLVDNGKVKMVTGSPGGTTIISSVYQSILHAIEFDMPVQEVVDVPRFHHQLLPKNRISYHKGFDQTTLDALTTKGYEVKESRFGDLHVIVNTERGLEAASESNGRGKSIVH